MAMLVSDIPTPPLCQGGSSVAATGHPLGMRRTKWFRLHARPSRSRRRRCHPASLDTEAVRACAEGVDGGWRMRAGLHNMQTERRGERETERGGRGREEAASIPSAPASAPTISPAHTQRCSWALRDTSWCLPSYPGAPTRSCGKAGVSEGWGVGWKRANPYQGVSMATCIG